jgi:hypothetical protein
MEKRRASNRKAAKRSRLRKKIFIEWLQQRAQLLEKDRHIIETSLQLGEHTQCLEVIKCEVAKLKPVIEEEIKDGENQAQEDPKEKAKRKRWSDPLEKLERYRERNREHAKKSRQQKKVFIEDLVMKVNELQKESEVIRATVIKELGEGEAGELLSKVSDPALLANSGEKLSVSSNIDTMGLLELAEKKMEEEGNTPTSAASTPGSDVAMPQAGFKAADSKAADSKAADSLYCLALASCRAQETESPSSAQGGNSDGSGKENDNGSSDDGASKQEAEAEAKSEAEAAVLRQMGSFDCILSPSTFVSRAPPKGNRSDGDAAMPDAAGS